MKNYAQKNRFSEPLEKLSKDVRLYLRMSEIAKTESAKEQLKVVSKLVDWHRQSEQTEWVIGNICVIDNASSIIKIFLNPCEYGYL